MQSSETSTERRTSFWNHLNALRRCILRIALVVGIISFFCFTFDIRNGDVGGISVPYPYPDIMHPIATKVFLRISHDLLPPDATLIALTPWAAVMIQLQISIMLGISLGMPMIVNEIARFLGPALRIREKQVVLRLALPSSILFVLGALFAYLFILPFSIEFLYQFADAMGIEQLFTVDKFVNFVILMTFAFGVVAELPVIIVGLSSLGLVSPEFWTKNWRWAALLSMIFAAIITPDGTGVTMMMIAAPMMALYFSGCVIAVSKNKALTIGLIIATLGCLAVVASWLHDALRLNIGGDSFGNVGWKNWLVIGVGLVAYAIGMIVGIYGLTKGKPAKEPVG
ncbi:MAG: twin-arginine translocase subunit TatC [Candidatus Thermoplasmatota archaeon]|nr:twin-arginine translocase subunit TatC [Candidatus Thermoplasmatota archaeon]MBU1913851.1 twin-arginine translocase subunit TatC [Candidatus Thermoplasmatota archaeon]